MIVIVLLLIAIAAILLHGQGELTNAIILITSIVSFLFVLGIIGMIASAIGII